MTSFRTKVKPPTNLSVTYTVSDNSVVTAQLAWAAPGNAWANSYYVVYRDGDEIATSITALTYQDEGVAVGGQFAYQVSTVNVHEFEGEQTTTAPLDVPTYPVWDTGWNLSVDQNTTGSVATRASDPDGRAITYSKSGGTAPGTVTVNSAGTVTVGATAGGGYTLGLRASNGILYTDTTISLTVTVPTTAPNPPVLNLPQVVSSTQINWSWTKAATGIDPDDYDADISTTGTGGWTALTPLTGPTALSYQSTGLSANTQYFIRVRALNGGQPSSYATTSAITLASGTREIFYDGTFESGAVGANGSLVGGALYECKFQPEGGVNTFYSSTDDGYNTLNSSGFDCRIRSSETFDGVTITPPRGSYFMPQVLWYDKEYECINGTTSGANDQLDKPRIKMQLSNTAYDIDFDREIWVGFSVFTHPNHIHDVATRAHQGGNYHFWVNAGNTLTQFYLTTFGRPLTVPNSRWSGGTGGSSEWWILGYQKNPNAVTDMVQSFSGANTYYVALADRANDVGLWCHWVFRYRLNPFSVSTNGSSVSGGKNHVYEGNKGIMQIWKSTGPYLNGSRDRAWVKVYDLFNSPIGGVPPASIRLNNHFGIYKYGWKKNPSSNDAPGAWIYNAKAQIRLGCRKPRQTSGFTEVPNQDGTKDVDVTHDGGALTGWSEQA